MAGQPSYVSIDEVQRGQIEEFARSSPGWQVLSHQNIPLVFPETLRAKLDSVVAIVSGNPSGVTILVFNALRVEPKADAIDHEPFGIVVLQSGASTGGMFFHHGDWDGRTEQPPPGFWDITLASGVGNYFYTNPPSGTTSGPLETLPRGHANAFAAVAKRLQGENPDDAGRDRSSSASC
jgi:hypothetical protein